MALIDDLAHELESLPHPVSSRPHVTGNDPADVEDSATRAAWGIAGKRPWGKGLRAAFYADLPPTPRGHVSPDHARSYLDAILAAIERGGWSTREREKLRVIRRRWEARVSGEDYRFRTLGGVFSGRRKVPADRLAELRMDLGTPSAL